MTGPTTARPMRPPANTSWRRRVPLVVLALAAIALALPVFSGPVESPGHVDRISFQNPTVYNLHIEVTGRDRDSWVGVGTARRGATTTFEEVLDHGAVWIFRFMGQGEDGGELHLTRGQLEQAGWKVVVPDNIGDALRAKGAPPSL